MLKPSMRALTGVLLSIFIFVTLAPSTFADYSEGESFYNQKYELPGLHTVRPQSLSAQNSSGAFVYNYPISVPPGRNGLEPSLQITYNSQNREHGSLLGLGWGLDMPSISRLNKKGVDKMYEEPFFTSTLDGELVETVLSDTEHGEYTAKIQSGAFLDYEYNSSGYWTITDKSGTVYTFGTTTDTRLDNPSDSSQVFQWFLEEVRDTNNNFIRYEYYKEDGQIYPESITYTGNGSTDGIFSVEFDLEIRSDAFYFNDSGFEVLMKYRLSGVNTYVDGTQRRSYVLVYDTGTNGSTSLLSSITEHAWAEDGSLTTKPATTFTYTDSPTWETSSSYSSVGNFFSEPYGSTHFTHDDGGRLIDLNGDALPDFVYSTVSSDYSANSTDVYITQAGGGVVRDTSYDIPVGFIKQDTYEDQGVNFADVNGDGLVDFLKNDPWDLASDNGVYINQGDGTWLLDTSYNIPLYTIDRSTLSGQVRDYGTRVFDVNGDGLSDLVYAMEIGSSTSYTVEISSSVYINKGDGTGWELDSDYILPVGFIDYDPAYGGADRAVRILDFNSDGLLDFIKDYDGNNSSDLCVTATYCIQNGYFVNKGDGTGWERINYGPILPDTFISENSNSIPEDYGSRLIDINADGLADMITSIDYGSSSYDEIQLFSSNYLNWTEVTSPSIPIPFKHTEWLGDYGARFDDLNGDGAIDFLLSGIESEFFTSVGGPSEMLEHIELSTGASTSIEYEGSGEVDNDNQMPFIVQTVSSIVSDDGLGETSTTTFDYEGGAYLYEDELNRQFAGFSSVSKTEDGRITETFYEQDDFALIGRPYQTDVYDESGNLYTRSIDTWATSDLGYENDFVYKTQSTTLTYDGVSSHRDTGTAYTYDSNGNVKTVINYGEVTASTDGTFTDVTTLDEKTTVTYTYAVDASGGEIRNKVAEEKVTNSSGAIIKRTRYFYDSNTSYLTVSTGNLFRQADWYDTTGGWYNSYYTYNAYGLVATAKNRRGYTTRFTYDTYNLYPAVTTNPKSYTVSSVYDAATGQMTSRTDENSITSESTYDGLGRLLTVSVPDPTTGVLTTLSTTTYDDTSVPSSVSTTSTVGGVTSESVTYMDGYGRTVQSNTLAEDSLYTTVDTWYDGLGNVETQSLPYSTSSSVFGRDDSQYGVTTTYDPLNRPLTVTSPTGSTGYDYSQWENTVTDANGISKVYNYEAAGRLIQVDEQNDGATYTSTYEYDPLGQLITLTDSQGNERNFDYDSLGRKISQEDLHDPAETTFGTWRYTYDQNNNLLTQTDPKGQVITWAYESLDRVAYEDWDTSTSARDVNYVYDISTRGRMKLYRVNSNNLDHCVIYSTYDYLGNPTKETRYFLNPGLTTYSSYIFFTTYDLLSRPTKLIYPSSALTVNTTYNATGALEKITRGTSTLSNVISDIDYTPAGQVSSMTYANGVTTTNTYDAAESYRLINKTTTGSYSGVSGNIQNLAYTYDSVGNITGVADTSITPTAKTISYSYDDLNRLMSASTSGLAAGDYTETYTYDEVGNLTYKSNVGTLTYAGTGATANPHAVTDVAGTAYSYDDNGNMASDGTNSYSWDKRNRMTASGSLAFSYNASGSRYRTADSTSGTTVYNYYLSPYEEIRNGVKTYYIFAGSQRVASLEGTTYTYYHNDHLGGTALTTDSTGAVSQVYDYYPYGSELINEQIGSSEVHHSFTDKELEDALGLYYFEARWYDGEIGRFGSLDPAQLDNRVFKLISDPQSLNFYAYSRNNPIVLTDPTGELTTFGAIQMFTNPSVFALYTGGRMLAQSLQYRAPITSNFLEYSLMLNPGDVTITEANQAAWGNVVDQIKGTDEFQSKVDGIISNAEANGQTSINGVDGNVGLRLNETSDLKMAIGTANMQVNGTQLEDGSWDLNISVTDTYHFDKNFDYGSMTYNGANNVAAGVQDAGLISTFDETIQFSTTHE